MPGQVRTLPRTYYTSEAVYREEAHRIFGRRWMCAGRAEQIAEAGSYFLADVAGESLIVVRDRAAAPRAFFNVCRHRGTRLCEEGSGRLAGTIQCPYHGWTYALDGRLLGAPHMAETPGFDPAEFPLHPAALGEWEGFLFVSADSPTSTLAATLAPLAAKFSSWRLGHCPRIHPELTRLSHYRSGANDLTEGPILGGYMTIEPPGESLTLSGQAACPQPVGPLAEDDRRRVYYYSIFPNLFLTLLPDYVMWHTLWPVAPDRTRIICEWLFAPHAMTPPAAGPEDAVAFWDRTNRQDWHICELAQQGVSSRAYTPGPYAVQESLLAAFDREYLAALGDTAEER
ncbi:MAG: (2Fe-2S)-binding protein [Acidobacteria bacterium]|nr:MAG: (2Fe-2S)-binding protein [Acidobacteriota bacterium]